MSSTHDRSTLIEADALPAVAYRSPYDDAVIVRARRAEITFRSVQVFLLATLALTIVGVVLVGWLKVGTHRSALADEDMTTVLMRYGAGSLGPSARLINGEKRETSKGQSVFLLFDLSPADTETLGRLIRERANGSRGAFTFREEARGDDVRSILHQRTHGTEPGWWKPVVSDDPDLFCVTDRDGDSVYFAICRKTGRVFYLEPQ